MKTRVLASLTAAVLVCAMVVPCMAAPGDSVNLPEAPNGTGSTVTTGNGTNTTPAAPVTAPVTNVTTDTTQPQTPVADAAEPVTQITSTASMQSELDTFDAEHADMTFEEKADVVLPNGLTYLENALNVIVSDAVQNTDNLETVVEQFPPEVQAAVNSAVEQGTTINDYVPLVTFDVSSSMATRINTDGSMEVDMEYTGITTDSKLLVLNFHSENTDKEAAATAYAATMSDSETSNLGDIYNNVNVVPYKIPADDKLTLTFTELSPVTILKLSDEGIAKAEAAAAETNTADTTTANTDTGVEEASSFPWAIGIVVVIVIVGAGVYVYKKKKAKVNQ